MTNEEYCELAGDGDSCVGNADEVDPVAEINRVGYGDTVRFVVDPNELYSYGVLQYEKLKNLKDRATKALVAKKPIRANRAVRKNGSICMLDENEFWKCPNNHGAYDVPLKENQKFCHECGQAIDWSK